MVVLNTVIMAAENMDKTSKTFADFRIEANIWFTWLFVGELILKLYALGIAAYCKDFMNLFDAIIVVTSVLDLFLFSGTDTVVTNPDGSTTTSSGGNSALKSFKALKALRVLKTLRILRTVKLLRMLDYL